MAKLNEFQKQVKVLLEKNGWSALKFSKKSGIPARCVQRVVKGESSRFDQKNERLFYLAMEKLEGQNDPHHGKDILFEITERTLPAYIKINDITIKIYR